MNLNAVRTLNYRAIIGTVLLFVTSIFKGFWLMGTYKPLMGALGLVAPVVSLFDGGASLVLLVMYKLILKFFMGISVISITWYMPTVFATWYLHSSSRLLIAAVCASAMALFVIHPVGYQVPLYSLFWTVPVICLFMKDKHIFWSMLGSSFIAHAIGSVLWIYQVPTTPAYFYHLTPVVCLERLCIALAMTMFYNAIVHVYKRVAQCYVMNNVRKEQVLV